jgi:hypothetical protein
LAAAGAAGMALIVVNAFEELLAGVGSFVAEEIETVFVAGPAVAGASIDIAIAGAAPTERDDRVHVTVLAPPQLQPEPEADTRTAPAGSVSVTAIDVAAEGPALETLSVYVIGWPGQTAAGAPLCVTDMSALAKTVDVVEAPLLAADGSLVDEVTDAMFVIAPAADGALTTIEIGAAEATPSEGSVQVTGPAPLQLQPAPDAETKEAPAGSVSVTVSELACEGPAFPTVSVYVSGKPAPTGSGEAPAPRERSACVA